MDERSLSNMNPYFPTGKLPQEFLARLIARYTHQDSRIVVGPKVGEDATVIDFGETCLVAKTDPITFATDEIGWYAININANDIATMGAKPRWFLATILLPEKRTDEALVESIFSSIHRAASTLGIAVCGGHTEISYGLDRPIVVGQMLGEVPKEKLVQSSGLKVGDGLLLTKGLAIEATSIIAREKGEDLLARGKYDGEFLRRCGRYLYDPGVSVLKEAAISCALVDVHGMHDPTEGGVSAGLYELAAASDRGLEIYRDACYISPESQELCEAFDIDPLGAISSGALLIGLDAGEAEEVMGEIRKIGIRCDLIGTVQEKSFGVKMIQEGQRRELPKFDRDEIAKLF